MASAIDQSTLQTIDDGREAFGDVLSSAQSELRKIFLVFALGFALSFYALINYFFPYLKGQGLVERADAVATSPFNIVLLQTKVSMILGLIIATPMIIWVSRDVLRERGWLPKAPLSRLELGLLIIGVIGLFGLGVAYAQFFFAPLLFQFLAENAIQSGLAPKYQFVKWFRFFMLITIGMGVAAELPLFMVLLSYSGIVPYETFRDKWRHAVVVIYAFGAMFTPPDPFTQVLWGTPVFLLYLFSLFLSRFVLTIKYSSDEFGLWRIAAKQWNFILGSAVLTGFAVYYAFEAGIESIVNSYLASYEIVTIPPIESVVPIDREPAIIAIAVGVALLAGFSTFIYRLFATVDISERLIRPSPASSGDPSEIDIGSLDASAISVAPKEAFLAMDEDEALAHASRAMDNDDSAKAQAILDRFDAVEEQRQQQSQQPPAEAGEPAPQDASGTPAQSQDDDGDVGSVVTGTTAGVVNSFTEEERTEDDIGGYFYDLQFILSSLTSKSFRIIGLFVVVMGSVFTVMYQGGLKVLKNDFLSRLPPSVTNSDVQIVPLHPVEMLIFDVKLSVIAGIVAVTPLLLYYMTPALNDRGFVSGRANWGLLSMWVVSSLGALLVGSAIGYMVVAPNIISWLAWDVIQSNMLIRYRISSFGWLVFFTTIGVGLLAVIPTTMVYLHRSGLMPFRVIRSYWREAVVAIICVIAVAAPEGVFGMLLFSLPVVLSYLIGLLLLWLYTLGGRRVSPFHKTRRV